MLKSVLRVVRTLLAAAVIVVVSVSVEEFASRHIRVPPVTLSDHLVRLFACFIGSAAAHFFSERRSYSSLGPVVAFYLWYDWSRAAKFFVIDWHPFEWYPLPFPSYEALWTVSAIPATIAGLALGRYVTGVLLARMDRKVGQRL
jgi:hypothetical protein